MGEKVHRTWCLRCGSTVYTFQFPPLQVYDCQKLYCLPNKTIKDEF